MGPLVILGPGTLGLSLARHAAESGLEVRLVGRDCAHANMGALKLRSVWQRAREQGRLDASTIQVFNERLGPSENLVKALGGASAMIECLPEDLPLKAVTWSSLGTSWPKEVMPLTASSCLPASLIQETAGCALGMQNFHLFVPVHRHPLVELASPPNTPEIYRFQAQELAKRLGLRMVSVKEAVGLAASRMGLIQGLEAMRLLEGGHGTSETLDTLMTEGYGHPCGPLELSDRIGLDLRLTIAEHLHRSTADARFSPPNILKEMVAKGELGRKSGRGFYAWNPDGTKA